MMPNFDYKFIENQKAGTANDNFEGTQRCKNDENCHDICMKRLFFSVQKFWNHTINITFWKWTKKIEFLQKITTFRPHKVQCLVHTVQKYKLNGTLRLENMTRKILEKKGIFSPKMSIFTTKIQIYKLEWWFGNSWKSRKIHPKWQQNSGIFSSKNTTFMNSNDRIGWLKSI